MAPILAAHLLLTEVSPVSIYPKGWDTIRYDKVDRLYLHPFQISVDNSTNPARYHCVLDPSLQSRLTRIMARARQLNPDIKLIAQQQHDPSEGVKAIKDLGDNDLKEYASSVAKLMTDYNLDGYDLDYEENAVCPKAPQLMAAVKTSLKALPGPKTYYVSISPAVSTHFSREFTTFDGELVKLEDVLDCVNVQTYDGGWTSTNNYLSYWEKTVGMPASKLLCGILPEQSYVPGKNTPTIEEAEQLCTSDSGYSGSRQPLVISSRLGGVHLWRLNSDNMNFENAVQVVLFDHLRGGKSADPGHMRLQESLEAIWLDGPAQKALPVQSA